MRKCKEGGPLLRGNLVTRYIEKKIEDHSYSILYSVHVLRVSIKYHAGTVFLKPNHYFLWQQMAFL